MLFPYRLSIFQYIQETAVLFPYRLSVFQAVENYFIGLIRVNLWLII